MNKREKPLIRLYEHCGSGLIIEYPSGVIYSNQVGGYACEQRELEGVFAPVGNEVMSDGKKIHSPENDFIQYFSGPKYNGTGAFGLDHEDADFVDATLKKYHMNEWVFIDRAKLNQSCEAWVWVIVRLEADTILESFALENSGVLTWQNSD